MHKKKYKSDTDSKTKYILQLQILSRVSGYVDTRTIKGLENNIRILTKYILHLIGTQ